MKSCTICNNGPMPCDEYTNPEECSQFTCSHEWHTYYPVDLEQTSITVCYWCKEIKEDK